VLHLEKFIRSPLDVLADLVAMRGPVEKRPQDKHVERSLQEPNPLLYWFRHRRHSTLKLAMMVGIRLSVVKGCGGEARSSELQGFRLRM
jgi:hypothetical protein